MSKDMTRRARRGRRIRLRREGCPDASLEQLAAILKVTPGTLSRWERGLTVPSHEDVELAWERRLSELERYGSFVLTPARQDQMG